MNITILSGGSGNDALVKGLKKLYKNINVKVITNMYDSGKSTGVCRKITNTLGVSDVRKNHERMYKAMCKNPDARIIEFYSNRYTFNKGNEVEEIKSLLYSWGLEQFEQYVDRFFANPLANKFTYNDFSVANIIYSQMYAEIGYESTNKYFTELLGLDDFVLINSFDNVYINAITDSGKVILDEGDIVEYKNADDKINSIVYLGGDRPIINNKAIFSILNADLVIISTGTFWSSIYPTLDYGDFYKYVNRSHADKIWIMNNEFDKDSYGVSSNDFISKFEELGLDLSDFKILENLDSIEELHEANDKYNIYYRHMENNKGKHNADIVAKEILKIHFNLDPDNVDKILFDFDDTIWSRNDDLRDISIDNVKLIGCSLHDKSIIVSGNSYDSIYKKLSAVFGSKLDGFDVDIWADSNSVLRRKNDIKFEVDEFNASTEFKAIKELIEDKFDLSSYSSSKAYLKYKPLSELERSLLVEYINNLGYDVIAKKTGKTTVDVMHSDNNKSKIFDILKLSDSNTLYIGDEIDSGNDADIAKKCTNFIHVDSVEDTNLILKLLV